FDNDFFGATPITGQLLLCGTSTTDTTAFLYWIGFTSYPTMNASASGSITRGTSPGVPCSPITEIYNPNVNFGGGDHDIIISGVVGTNVGAQINGVIRTDDISNVSFTNSLSGVNYSGGVSAIIFDDVNASGQASSVYFSTLQT